MDKINFVTQNIAPFRLNWLKELSKYYNITIFHNGEYDKTFNLESLNNYDFGRLEVVNIKKRILGLNFYNYYRIFKEKSDILILDGYGFISQIILIVLLRILRVRYILSIDGGIEKKEGKIKKTLKKYMITGATKYLSTSHISDSFLEYYGVEKKNIYRHRFSSLYKKDILNEVVKREEKEMLRKKYNIIGENVIVGIGRFIKEKGFETLINVMEYLPKTTLILIGGEKKVYKRIIEKKNLKNIKIVEFVSKDKIKKYLDLADIFVLPTYGDVWGLVINEAMARGLPIITTNKCVAGLSLIEEGKNGYLIEPGNTTILKKKLKTILEDHNLREQMGRENLKKIEKYSYESIVKEDEINLNRYKQEN